MTYLTEPLKADHKKSAFSCGKPALDNYLRRQAKQDMKRRLSVVFVLPDENNSNDIVGYYTLSGDSIRSEFVPPEIARKMPPSYANLPITLLGRLAIDQRYHGQGHGKNLLIDALKRSADIARSELGSIAVIVDPLDDGAVSFYTQYGFIMLPDRGRMFLPMKIIEQIF